MNVKAWCRREFCHPRRLVFNLLFYGLHCSLFVYGWYSQATNARLAALNSLQYSVWISRGAGLVLALDGALIVLPLLRNTIRVVRPYVKRALPLDENIWFHRQVAYSMAFWSAVHTTAHYVNFINVERTQLRKESAQQIHYTQPGGQTGHFMLLIMVLMYTTAQRSVRHRCFEAFWYTHHLAFFFLLALYAHATGCFVRDSVRPDWTGRFPFYSTHHCLGYESWRYTVGPGVLYFCERLWREVRARRATRLTKVIVHPGGAMELHIDKPSFKFVPGQWLFLQVPAISRFQWHPFTITSAPDDPYVSVHIRQVGDFTKALGTLVGAGPAVVSALTAAALRGGDADGDPAPDRMHEDGSKMSLPEVDLRPRFTAHPIPEPEPEEELGQIVEVQLEDTAPERTSALPALPAFSPLRGDFTEALALPAHTRLPLVRLDGPYGAPTADVFAVDVALLVGAGIGITPFSAILRHVWYAQRRGAGGRLRRVQLFWVCRDAPAFGWFQGMLHELEASQTDPHFLHINIYLTQRVDRDMMWNITLNDRTGPDADGGHDPLTLLRSRTMFGRPDWGRIYARIRTSIEDGTYLPIADGGGRTSVGTFYCGPATLAKVLKRTVDQMSNGRVAFSFAKVPFTFFAW